MAFDPSTTSPAPAPIMKPATATATVACTVRVKRGRAGSLVVNVAWRSTGPVAKRVSSWTVTSTVCPGPTCVRKTSGTLNATLSSSIFSIFPCLPLIASAEVCPGYSSLSVYRSSKKNKAPSDVRSWNES